MGCGLGKTNTETKGGEANEEEGAVSLQTKKEFQKFWEQKHYNTSTDINSIWNLSIAQQDISKIYIFDKKEIGAGHYGVVRKAQLKVDRSKVYAVKTIVMQKLKGDKTLLKNELEMLRFSDHPNIIQFYEIYKDEKCVHFVTEYCEGGDITTRLEQNGPFPEEDARRIIFEVLFAINHLHSCGIVHRDIKPDNFLFKTKKRDSEIKLIDFGLSKKFQQGSKLHSILGTPYYVAPEILEKRGYTEKVDVWSAGVMLFLLLVADFPFKSSNNGELFEKIKRGDFSMTASHQLRSASAECKALLRNLIERNPSKRFSAREALRDPWFDPINMEWNLRGKAVLTRDILQRLRSFKSESKFSKEVIRLLVMIHDDDPEVMKLKDAFFYLDVLDNGVITNVELRKAFDELGEETTDKEIEEIIKSLELRTHGIVTYSEFITAAIDQSFYANEKYLTEIFKRFDIDQDDHIGFQDIQDCFSRFGIDLTKADILKMINDFDQNADSKISYPEFIRIMKGDMHQNTSPLKRESNFADLKSPVMVSVKEKNSDVVNQKPSSS